MLLLSFSHFMVDFGCAFLVASFSENNLLIELMLYNFCAFALQMPLGILVERFLPYLKTASVGLMLVLFSVMLVDNTMIALVIAGIGNALFHLGAGINVLTASKKALPLGVFIAPGALGIYLGAFAHSAWLIPIAVALVVLAAALWIKKDTEKQPHDSFKEYSGKYVVMVSLFVVVALRGLIGVFPGFEWRAEWSLAFVLAVVLGKVVGGYLADCFGGYKVGIVSLAVSAICFIFPNIPILGLIGIFAFQVTMPITLCYMSKITYKGFGFGLLTFALFIGSVPIFMEVNVSLPIYLLSIVSLTIFALGTKKVK